MSDKILLSVLLPATGREYEFLVPETMTVDAAVGLISRMLAARESAYYRDDGDADLMLCGDVAAGHELNPKETLASLRSQGVLSDGERVALV